MLTSDEITHAGPVSFDIEKLIQRLPDADRLQWVSALCSDAKEPGTIAKIREIVNSPGFDE